MKQIGRDFQKYTSSIGIKDTKFNRYAMGMSPYILSEDDNITPIDIYSKLLLDKIIFVNGEIGQYNSELVKAQLLYLESIDSTSEIRMYINSPGGGVYSGMGILDTMEFISNDISTINTGLAASMAAVILSAGTKGKRKALKRSRTMIHQPLTGGGGYSQASDMEIDTRELLSLKRELTEIISENTGQDYDKVVSDMDRDYWMTAADTYNYGIIDEILIKR